MGKVGKISLFFCVCVLLFSSIIFATDEVDTNSSIDAENIPAEIGNILDIDNIMLISEYGENQSVEDETKYGDYFSSKDDVVIENDINGNVYIMGKNVNIYNNVINGNVFILAESVTINSNIQNSAYIIADNIKIAKDSQINDVYFMANSVEFEDESYVARESKIFASSVKLNGYMAGNAYINAENIDLEENAKIHGNLYYSGNLNSQENSIDGNVIHKESSVNITNTVNNSSIVKTKIVEIITSLITAFVIIGIIILLFDNRLDKNSQITVGKTIKSIFKGLGFIILIPIVSIAIMLTCVGAPISLIVLIIYILMFVIAIPVSVLEITNIVLKNKEITKGKRVLYATICFLIIKIIRIIPVLGSIVTFCLVTFGFEQIIKFIFKKDSNVEKEEIIVEK